MAFLPTTPFLPHTSCFGRKQEHFDLGIIRKFIDKTLPLVDLGAAVESNISEAQVCQNHLQDVEHLRKLWLMPDMSQVSGITVAARHTCENKRIRLPSLSLSSRTFFNALTLATSIKCLLLIVWCLTLCRTCA